MATCARITLKNRLLQERSSIDRWFEKKFSSISSNHIPFYSSFDLRDADYKIAPVDANLFPAGFNNICEVDRGNAPPLFVKTFLSTLGKMPEKVLIIPENHTRNHFYADNIYDLRQMIRGAGIHCEIGWWEGPDTKESAIASDGYVHLTTPEDHEIICYPLSKEGNTISVDGFTPDVILFNNDYSSGYPEFFKNVSQPLIPNPKLGWHTRRKDRFFHHYNNIVKDFSSAFGINPWAFSVKTIKVTGVDFMEQKGLDRLADAAQTMLTELNEDHKQFGCAAHKPFLFIKNNAGTYGIGVMKINDPQEILSMNKRDRTKMHMGKGNQEIHEVIIQEGIMTRFEINGATAEPAIYMTGQELLGGFLRTNVNRGKDDNLNSKGMAFEHLCMSDLKTDADRDLELELVYGTIAKMASLAVSLELQEY